MEKPSSLAQRLHSSAALLPNSTLALPYSDTGWQAISSLVATRLIPYSAWEPLNTKRPHPRLFAPRRAFMPSSTFFCCTSVFVRLWLPDPSHPKWKKISQGPGIIREILSRLPSSSSRI